MTRTLVATPDPEEPPLNGGGRFLPGLCVVTNTRSTAEAVLMTWSTGGTDGDDDRCDR